ncbi:MAG: hypothetical protein WBF14_09900 [Candidatus Acidiferrales bacterium]
MNRGVRAGLAIAATAALLWPAVMFGWGETAERLVANKAVDTLPDEILPFFVASRRFLVQHVSDPEEGELKSSAPPLPSAAAARSAITTTEPPSPSAAAAASHMNDFIQLDHYGTFPFSALPRDYAAAVSKYNRRTIEEYGLLPWAVGVHSQHLTDAFRNHNWDGARLEAALLAHYVAAAHDPFNTTINFDGKLSGQPGVNQRYGGALVDRYQLFFFVKPNEAAYIHDPTEYAFEMALGAHATLEKVLLDDRRARQGLAGYTDDYYDRFYALAGTTLVQQLSETTTDVGSYWMTSWINAGRPQLPQ